MLMSADSDRTKPDGGRIQGSFAERSEWSELQGGIGQTLRLFLGHEEKGPLVWLFSVDPVDFPPHQKRIEFRPAQAHYHRSPTFRVALGSEPKQFKFDQDVYGWGDYILLDANRFYQDPFGVDGSQVLLIFGDRRGFHPTNRKLADMTPENIILKYGAEYGSFGAALRTVNMRDEDADTGIPATFGTSRAGRLKGSLDEASHWTPLSDGSRVAAGGLGSGNDAPLIILSANAPGAVESPARIARTDTFRIVTQGTCIIGGRTYGAGSFVAVEAGSEVGKVVHGPEGSQQILLCADRRTWRQGDGSAGLTASMRQDEIGAIIEALSFSA